MEEQKKFVNEIISYTSFEVVAIKDAYCESVSYTGTPIRSSSDHTKIIILTDPFSQNDTMYEINIKDIYKIEETGTVSSEDGRSALSVKIWIKKGSTALVTKSFTVK